jgi:hypothetical protein
VIAEVREAEAGSQSSDTIELDGAAILAERAWSPSFMGCLPFGSDTWKNLHDFN